MHINEAFKILSRDKQEQQKMLDWAHKRKVEMLNDWRDKLPELAYKPFAEREALRQSVRRYMFDVMGATV